MGRAMDPDFDTPPLAKGDVVCNPDDPEWGHGVVDDVWWDQDASALYWQCKTWWRDLQVSKELPCIRLKPVMY